MSTSRFDLRGLRDRDELQAFGKELAYELKTDDVASLAAAVSFKIVLALFPALLATVAIYAFVADPGDIADLAGNLPDSITEAVSDQLDEFIDQARSGGVAIAGIAVGLWAASGAATTLNKALSRAYDEADDRKLPAQRGVALVVTAALLLALIAISVLLVAGGAIEDAVLGSLPLTEGARTALDVAATFGRYVAAILLLMVLFAFIYWIGPDYERRPRWVWITPGAALAVVTWLLASALFGWYVANYGSYTASDSVYGPLGNAIVFMLWLQLSMFALLLGAEVNQVLAVRARRRHAAGGAGAGPVGTDAGSIGMDADGGGSAPRADAAQPSAERRAAVGLRAATTPTRGRATIRRSPASFGGGHDRPAGAEGAPGPRSADPVSVGSHGGADGAGTAQDGGPGGVPAPRAAGRQDRQVPAATLAGAAVAAVSGLVGLTGLLRRLKG